MTRNSNLPFILLLLFFANQVAGSIVADSILSIGGNIWGEDDNNCVLDNERGGFGVKVDLLNAQGQWLQTTISDSNSFYEFKNLPEGTYIVSLNEINFKQGGPLYGLQSCNNVPIDSNNDEDNDNNGYGPLAGPIQTTAIQLTIGGEPHNNGNANYTIDFGFAADCNTPNPLSYSQCSLVIDTICDANILDLLCAMLDYHPDTSSFSICGNNEIIKNMNWFAFVAGYGDYSLNIDLYGCVGGYNGAQVALFNLDDCDSFSTQELFCTGDTCRTGAVIIPGSILIPGQTYYLLINGCGGSNCRYDIDILGNFIQYQSPDPIDLICTTPIPHCDTITLNQEVTFESLNEVKNATYTWEITSPDGAITTVTTTSNTLTLSQFNWIGTYTIEVVDIYNKCSVVPISPISKSIYVRDTINSLTPETSKEQMFYSTTHAELIFADEDNSGKEIMIFDGTGRLVLKRKGIIGNRFSIKDLPNGVYLVQWRDKLNKEGGSIKMVR